MASASASCLPSRACQRSPASRWWMHIYIYIYNTHIYLYIYTYAYIHTYVPSARRQARPQDGECFGELPPLASMSTVTRFPMVVPSAQPAYFASYTRTHLIALALSDQPEALLGSLAAGPHGVVSGKRTYDVGWRRRSSVNKNSVLRKEYRREDQYLSIEIQPQVRSSTHTRTTSRHTHNTHTRHTHTYDTHTRVNPEPDGVVSAKRREDRSTHMHNTPT